MSSFEAAATVDDLVTRLGRLAPTTPRRWGVMTPHAMLCHLADSFRVGLGECTASPAETLASRTIVRFIALHTPLPWPHGVPTRPEIDQQRGGTRPADFARDRETVVTLMRRFAAPGTRYVRHPMFGALSGAEWLTWAYRHTDHHLRQFGL